MKVTFPHMGNIYILIKTLFDELDIEYIIPPKCSNRTLEIGAKHAPEMACLPLKINIGNFIQAMEKGADTIVITGGCGPCRFGYYAEMHKEILKDLGYNVEIICLELNNKGIKELISKIKKLLGKRKLSSIVLPLYRAVKTLKLTDKLEELSYIIRCRELVEGSTDKILDKFHQEIKNVYGYQAINKLIEKTKIKLIKLDLDKSHKPLKIGLVGEIYTLIEPFTNINIDKILGNMGVEVNRSLYLSDWIIEHIVKGGLKIRKKQLFQKEAEKYLKTPVGGHAQETLGHSVIYARQQYDGIIQIYPLTCMPEIVADSIMPDIKKEFNIPVMTMIMDEMTGEAGYMTRIDAFVDMLKRKKEIKEKADELLLSGN
ncbi:MAG: acyl-CoA dehydratase activase-related protein [Bacillota bacterium]